MNIYNLRKQDRLSFDHVREETPDLSQARMHAHTDIEIYFLIAGSVEYHIENSVYTPKPGDVMIMRPGEMHTSKPDCSQPYERINLRFPPELLKESLNARLLIPFFDRPLGKFNHYAAEDLPSDFIRHCFDRMFAESPSAGHTRTISYLLPVLQEIYDNWQAKDPVQKKTEDLIPAQIVSYINKNLTELQSPQQLSDAFFMSQSQIYRIFRNYTGRSVWDYVRTRRLFTARELLQTGVSPHKAASDSGYRDYSTFYRAYKKLFGHSPLDDQKKKNDT